MPRQRPKVPRHVKIGFDRGANAILHKIAESQKQIAEELAEINKRLETLQQTADRIAAYTVVEK